MWNVCGGLGGGEWMGVGGIGGIDEGIGYGPALYMLAPFADGLGRGWGGDECARPGEVVRKRRGEGEVGGGWRGVCWLLAMEVVVNGVWVGMGTGVEICRACL